MSEKIGIGLVGLGVMGNRMLARLAEHTRLYAAAMWDPNPQAMRNAAARYPAVAQAESAEAVIAASGLRCLYIASPPEAHLAHANGAFDAGLAVFCEKPLTVDFAAGRRTIERIEREGRKAAVNFSLASSPGLATVARALKDGTLGELERVELEVAFERWPREWQQAAGRWLSERREGGFTREVISHFVFLVQRVLGPARVVETRPDYPPDGGSAERAIAAMLEGRGVPVRIQGRVGGEFADFNRLRFIGSGGVIEIHDWFGLRHRRLPGEWQDEATPMDNRMAGQRAQLDQLVAMIEGRAHTLPSFAEALAVQQTVERMLGNEVR
jgi:predicted dehydrogenase